MTELHLRRESPVGALRQRRSTPAATSRVSALGAGFALAALVLVASPGVLNTYAQNILTQAFLFAVAALTVDLLWGYTGILSFGQSAFFGIGAYAIGLAFTHAGYSPPVMAVAVLGAVVLAVALGGLVGWLSFWHGASPLYAGAVTLALPIVFVQLVLSGGTFTGSSSGLPGFSTPNLTFQQWYWLAGGLLLLVAACSSVLVTSDAGQTLIAIRENELRCRFLGIESSRVKTVLFATCGGLAALAGAVYAVSADVAAPQLGDFVLGTQFVIWTALGGRGTLIGPILGAVAINVVSALLGGNLPFVWLLVVGLVFVGVVVHMPEGLLPAALAPVRRLRRWQVQPRATAIAGVPAEASQPALAGSLRRSIDRIQVPSADQHVHGEPGQLALQLRDVSKHYGSLTALDRINLAVRPGELLGVVGPNGAGKTTLMRCISDGRERSGGMVLINGHDIGRSSPQRCVAYGLGRKFQTANVFETLTVRDCLRIARSFRTAPSLWRRSRTLELPATAAHAVRVTGLQSVLEVPARHLSHGLKQALELAMVLALEPTLLLLDEPTAGLTRPERTVIGDMLADLARSHGLSIILVEHDFDFVRNISTRMLVLHQGKVLLDGSVAEVAESELVKSVYLGSEIRRHGS